MKIAIIAGESSGDQLGADLVRAIREKGLDIDMVGVGGPALVREGLSSLFDYSDLSVMGLTAVLARLPTLIARIRETSDAIIAARPDVLVIIDSPDFTHRVARRVKAALPSLPVVNYVCPSVWAWKEHRARDMLGYVDLVLAILPFEPEVMRRLGGPETIYVGHRLAGLAETAGARAANEARWQGGAPDVATILIMPGSRRSEVSRLLPDFLKAARILSAERPCRFLLPAVPHLEASIRAMVADSGVPVEIISGEDAKWQAFGRADAALAASGTTLLELALSGVPVVSAYRPDWLVRLMMGRIKVWSAALPNLIADHQAIPEYFNQFVRPEALYRWLRRLATDTPQRAAQLQAFDEVARTMRMPAPSGSLAAGHVLELLAARKT